MDEPLAVALKFGFLAVLYLFLLWVSRSALRDLARGQEAVLGSEPVEAPGESRRRDEPEDGGLLGVVHPRLEVIAALGHEPGTVFDIAAGATLGRSDHAEIRIDDPSRPRLTRASSSGATSCTWRTWAPRTGRTSTGASSAAPSG